MRSPASLLAVVAMGAQSYLLRGAGSYLDQLSSPFAQLPQALIEYGWGIRHRFFGIHNRGIGWFALTVLALLGASGLFKELRKRWSVTEVFTLCHLGLLALWTTDHDVRLLMPIIPLWLMYTAIGARTIFGQSYAKAGGLLLAGMAVAFTAAYARADFGPIREGLGNPSFAAVADRLRQTTSPNAAIVFSKPRLLALVTGRRSGAYHHTGTATELLAYFRQIDAEFVLINREFEDDARYLEPLLQSNGDAAAEVFAEGSFHLYRLTAVRPIAN